MTRAAATATPAPPDPRPTPPAGVWLGALADTGIVSPPAPYPCRCAGAGGCKRRGRYCTCYGRRIEPHLPQDCCAILNLSRAAWDAIRQPLSAPLDVEVILCAPLDVEAAPILSAPLDPDRAGPAPPGCHDSPTCADHHGQPGWRDHFCDLHGHYHCPPCEGRPAGPHHGRRCATCGDFLSEWLPYGATLHTLCRPRP